MIFINNKYNYIKMNKSSCFYCTHPFDNEPVFIPTDEFTNEKYGCYCSVECAAGFLFNEPNISNNTKLKRFEILKRIYKKYINPAANPHYLLNTFDGFLSIDEYRYLNKHKFNIDNINNDDIDNERNNNYKRRIINKYKG
jgi:hypothetical protein